MIYMYTKRNGDESSVRFTDILLLLYFFAF